MVKEPGQGTVDGAGGKGRGDRQYERGARWRAHWNGDKEREEGVEKGREMRVWHRNIHWPHSSMLR